MIRSFVWFYIIDPQIQLKKGKRFVLKPQKNHLPTQNNYVNSLEQIRLPIFSCPVIIKIIYKRNKIFLESIHTVHTPEPRFRGVHFLLQNFIAKI